MTSVNTNYGALVALQSLSKTTRDLAEVQNRINTGLKVASAKDNGAVFAIAEGQRTRLGSLGAVQDGIDRATSAIDVGLSAGEAIGDILKQMKDKAVAAQATDLSDEQRDALNQDFTALRDQVNQIANAATFNGANLVNGTNLAAGASTYSVLTSDVNLPEFQLNGGGSQPGFTVHATLNQLTGIALTATEVTFSVGGVDYDITVAGTDTIGDFIDAVNTTTGGVIRAEWDEGNGRLVYSASDAFTVVATDGTNPVSDGALGALDGGATNTAGTAAATGQANSVTVSAFDFRLGTAGQALSGVTSTLEISTVTDAANAVDVIDDALTTLNTNLAQLGSQSKALGVQKVFLGKLADSIEAGIGNLVDADLAKESARLQALQVKQQLGAQALSIANSAPSIILSFFR